MNKKECKDFLTFPRSFEKYKWYKPILVLIIGLIIFFILQMVVVMIFSSIYGADIIFNSLSGGYETMDSSDAVSYISYLSVAILIPSLYIASRIVRDRPFSSYASSRDGWSWKIYFKALIIPFILYFAYSIATVLINGKVSDSEVSNLALAICLILVPLQCIAEEFIFRGFLMQTFGSWFKIPVVSIIAQAVIFAAAHPYNLFGVLDIFIVGVIFGVLAYKTNGLEVGSALHSINNLSMFYLVALGFEVSSSTVSIVDFIAGVVLVSVSVVLIYYIGSKYDWFC